MNDKITVQQYKKELNHRVLSFILYWENESRKKSTHEVWPDKMSVMEWHDQFLTYMEN